MPWIERVRTEQPLDAGVGIDWANPLTRGMVSALHAPQGGFDAVTGERFAVKGTEPAKVSGPSGIAMRFSGTNGYFKLLVHGSWPLTHFCVFQPQNLTSDQIVMGSGSAAPAREYVYFIGSSAGDPFWSGGRTDANDSFSAVSADSGAAVGAPITVASVYESSTSRSIFVGNKKVNNTAAAGTTSLSRVLYGCGSTGPPQGSLVGDIFAGFVWTRGLSDAEILSLNSNPWQIFEKERVWVPVPVDTRAKTYLSRIRTEQPLDAAARIAPEYASRVVDGFVGTGGLTLKGKLIDETAYITKTPSAMGMGRRGTSNAGFSFPCDLSSMGAITLVFQFIQHSRSGIQVLVEHSANANSNHGTFFIYTDTGANSLVIGTQSWGSYDYGSIALPALDKVTTLAMRLKISTAGAAGDLEVWVNGIAQTLTPDTSAYLDYTFGDYSTYFLGRGGLTYLADATVGMYVAMSGTVSDATMKGVSTNPWQLFENEQVRLLPLVVAGSDATTTQASGVSTAGSLAGAAGTAGVCSAAAGTSTPSGLVGSGTVSTTITQTDGVSTAGLLSGVATSSTSIGQVAGISTVSDLPGNAVAIAVTTSVAGVSTASSVAATSSSVSAPDASPGVSTAALLVASASSDAAVSISAGSSVAEALVGSTANGSVFAQADGISTISTLAASSVASATSALAAGNSSAMDLAGTSVADAAPTTTTGATTASVLGGNTSNGSTITQADCASAAGTLGATAVAATGGVQADGTSTASALDAAAATAAIPVASDSTSTAGTLGGVGSAAGSSGITAGAGTSAASALVGGASAVAEVTTALGVSAAADLAGGGTVSAALTVADGTAVPGTLIGAGIAPTVASVAAGTSSAGAMIANSAATTGVAQADGFSDTAVLPVAAVAAANISHGAGGSSTNALGASGNVPADVSVAAGTSSTTTLGGVATHVAVLAGAAGASTASAFATSAVAATIAIAAASVSSARALAGTPPNTAGASGVVHEIAAENRTSAIGTDVRTSTVLFGERWATVTI